MAGALLSIVPAPPAGDFIGGHEQMRAREAKPQVEVNGVSFLLVENRRYSVKLCGESLSQSWCVPSPGMRARIRFEGLPGGNVGPGSNHLRSPNRWDRCEPPQSLQDIAQAAPLLCLHAEVTTYRPASSQLIKSPLARRRPHVFREKAFSRVGGRFATKLRHIVGAISYEPSVEASSTTMIHQTPRVCANIESIAAASHRAPL